MLRNKNVQDAHFSARFRELHMALIAIASAMNRPRNDEAMVRDAGIPLDGALFPLLVSIERFGPIGVVEVADRLGRDYTTVSRQVARLETQGLVRRQSGAQDRRVREAVVTPQGKAMTDAVDAARERKARQVFADWSEDDVAALVRLVGRFAEAFERLAPGDADAPDAPAR